tara:strand:- start:87 stop:1037 length:951 start_codon:yes stop_codon:yes gene_type:complete
MPQLALAATVIAIIFFIGYLLIAGAIVIWPIFNILAYLKVLIFPRPIRKKYGTDLSKLNKDSFEIEISNKDKNDIKKHETSITALKNKLKTDIESIKQDILVLNAKVSNISSKISALGSLKINNDGSYSQRSNAGKEAYALDTKKKDIEGDIYLQEKNIEDLKFNNKNEIDDIKIIIQDIKNKPWIAWNEWSSRYARYLSNKNSIIFMFVGFPIFFAILGLLNSYSFLQVFHLYVYISYIQPIADIIGLQSFQTGFSSNFISYEYAARSIANHGGAFSFWSWIFYTLTMPILTVIYFSSSYKSYRTKAQKIEPAIY